MTAFAQLTEHDIRYCDNAPHSLLERFNTATQDHQMTILQNEGVYRHLHFKKPHRSEYQFHLVTWPGHLVITGDMGSYTFARAHDMFQFFTGYINTDYWAEKLQFGANFPQQYVKSHNEENFLSWVIKDFWEKSRTMDYEETRIWWDALRQWVFSGMVDFSTREQCADTLYHYVSTDYYEDIWEIDWDRYDWHFEYCLAAIVAGIRTYHAHTAQTSSP